MLKNHLTVLVLCSYKNGLFYLTNHHINQIYAVQCNNVEDILTTTNYGYEFVSGFEKNNIIGFQFHPEKSHKFGMQLFKNFVGNYNA